MRGRKQNGSRRRKYNCRHSRFGVGGMDAQTANDHIPADGLIDDDTLVQLGETTFTILNGKGRSDIVGHSMIARRRYDGAPAAGADPRSDGIAVVPASPSNTTHKHVRGVVIETTPHDEGSLKP